MNKMKCFALFLMAVLMFLSGCSLVQQASSGGGENYFPHTNGYSWYYTGTDGSVQAITVEGTAVVSSTTVQIFKGYYRSGSGYTSTNESYYRIDGSGVYAYSSTSSTPLMATMLAFPLEVGKSWDVLVSSPYSTKGSVLAKESVTVPAGTFDCYKVKISSYLGTVETYSSNMWFGHNAGMVKTTSSSSTVETVLQSKNF